MPQLLAIEGLGIAGDDGALLVRSLSLTVGRGEVVGLVGESGSGKTLTALAVLGLLPPGVRLAAGSVRFAGSELTTLDERALRAVRGAGIGMIFQEPTSALNPVMTIGSQIREAIRAHARLGRRAARAEARRLLELVAMPDADQRLRAYPHQLSGGQRQRAMIAMALAAGPDLLIADEPTTALDVTVQAQMLELLESLRVRLGLAVLLITHDLGVVAESCDRVIVVYAGEVVEQAAVEELFAAPRHPYTRGLLAALPRLGGSRGAGQPIRGQVPDPRALPAGCAFHPRCDEAWARCAAESPALFATGAGAARCFLHDSRGAGE